MIRLFCLVLLLTQNLLPLMKKYLLLLLLGGNLSFAQSPINPVSLPIDSTTGAVQFRDVVSIDPALDTKAIMQRARSWVATVYKNAQDVVQQYDQEQGILIVKGQFPMIKTTEYRMMGKHTTSVPIAIYHMLTVEAKPGRYRVTMNNFEQGAGAMRVVLQSNLGTMTEEEYMEEVRKSAKGSGVEKMAIKMAQKNAPTALDENRRYANDIKQKCLSILESLKQQMQKKGEKDW